MPGSPPRFGPTVVLAAVWVALYLVYLAVKPEPDATPRPAVTTTTTSATTTTTAGPRPG